MNGNRYNVKGRGKYCVLRGRYYEWKKTNTMNIGRKFGNRGDNDVDGEGIIVSRGGKLWKEEENVE